MHIDSGTVVAVAAVVGSLMAAAAILGQWRVSRNTTATTQYREIAQGWEDKARLQADEIADLQADKHRKDREIAELKGKVQVLQDALTGKASWEILESRIGEALAIAGEMRTELRQVHEMLAGHAP